MITYRINPDMVHRTIAGSEILVSTGAQAMKSNAVIELSETGTYLWEKMGSASHTGEELACFLTEEYDVSYSRAVMDVIRYMDELCAEGGIIREQK